MHSRLLKLFTIGLFCGLGFMTSFAMTDQQVVDYVKQQMANGKSKQQIYIELKARGVTDAQAKQLMEKYQNGELGDASQSGTVKSGTAADNRLRTSSTPTTRQPASQQTVRDQRQMGNTGTLRDQRQMGTMTSGMDDYYYTEPIRVMYDENGLPITDTTANAEGEEVFGHSLFNSNDLTFAPNPNMATPKNYKLGPGDEVYIDIWGESEDHINSTISPEGSIMISQIGPVYLNGLTIDQANNYLKQLFSSKYAGMSSEETQVKLTLGNIRSISVDIMGEVKTPGTLTISPFSTVFSALYQAGGINNLGSIRNIQVMRDGRNIAKIDLYDYIFRGKKSVDIRLQEGDVIMVPTSTTLVNIEGNVKRPMHYEMLATEPISKLIEYAGGFSGNAYTDMVTINRNDSQENLMINVPTDSYATFTLKDGDSVTVGQVNDRYQNRVELMGAVMRPGYYAVDSNINTIGKLLTQDALLEDAFTDRVLIYRQADDLSLEIIPVNLTGIMNGSARDIALRRNDMIVVQSVQELMERGPITISGMVNMPGEYPYAANTTIEDLILMAGGLKEGASYVRADVARRVNDPYATQASNNIATLFSFSIKDGYVIEGDRNFVLMPYDIVQIRIAPGYTPQKLVMVTGEVNFKGEYALAHTGERISDLILRCGGLTSEAYVKGASLIRRMTDDEKIARDQALKLAQSTEEDSISTNKLILTDTYPVGIDLEAALANPGSTYDIVLRDGDLINVPETQTTVKITGEVMSPTVTTFVPGKKYKYYVDMAGGYGEKARKKKAFIVYMNGTVTKLKGDTPIEPGSEIIVPAKPDSSGTNWQQILALTSGFATLATMTATLYNIFK